MNDEIFVMGEPLKEDALKYAADPGVRDYGVPSTSGVFIQPRPMDGITGKPPGKDPRPEDHLYQVPPGRGKRFIEHISTFQTRLQSYWSKIYLNPDEAYRDSISNATAMRRDPVIMQPLRERQLATALLEHQVLPEDNKDPLQKKIAKELQQMITHTPFFTKYKLVLLEALWFGKYGINNVYDWEVKGRTRMDGKRVYDEAMILRDWIPVHGDKIRHEHESGRIGIMTSRVGWLTDNLDRYTGGIRVSDESRVQMVPLTNEWRKAFIVHKHEVEDGQFYDGQSAGMIHGVGLRTRVYWPWWFKQKLLQWIMEFAERFALGIQIWYYEHGNPESEKAVRDAAEKFSNENVILFPRPIGTEKQGPGYERIEPGLGGSQFFKDLLDDYWGKMIRKMIVGQVLTSDVAATGLGSNVAEQHRITFANIIKFDALNLGETMTLEYLQVLAEYNYPGMDWKPRLKLIVQEPDPKEIMEGAKMFVELGGQVSEDELREVSGFRKPEDGERTLGQSVPMPGQIPGQMPPGQEQPGNGRLAQQQFEFGKKNSPVQYQQWVTVGGHPEGGKQHVGGTTIQIEESGKIAKGPKALEGKNISKVDKDVAGTKKDERRTRRFHGREVARESLGIKQRVALKKSDWWKKVMNKLSESQKDILHGYTSEKGFDGFLDEEGDQITFGDINRKLRQKEPMSDAEKEIVIRMQDAINEHELPEDTTVYRGVTIPDELLDQYIKHYEGSKGKVQRGADFKSTSLDIEAAAEFAEGRTSIMFEIKPKHGIYVNPISEAPIEQEVILNRHTQFRVVDVIRDVDSDITDLTAPGKEFGTRKFTIIQLEEV